MQQCAGRTVRPVHLRVAVLTRTRRCLHHQRPAGQTVTETVAFRAQPRPRHFEHVFVVAAVRVVAAQAILVGGALNQLFGAGKVKLAKSIFGLHVRSFGLIGLARK